MASMCRYLEGGHYGLGGPLQNTASLVVGFAMCKVVRKANVQALACKSVANETRREGE
jgi:hypothetical protein